MSSLENQPFIVKKYEQAEHPFILTREEADKQIDVFDSYFATGSTGCGKTSILRYFHTVSNFKYRFLSEEDRYKVFGIYVRAQDLSLPKFTYFYDKKEAISQELIDDIGVLYVQLLVIYNLLNDIRDIDNLDFDAFGANETLEIVKKLPFIGPDSSGLDSAIEGWEGLIVDILDYSKGLRPLPKWYRSQIRPFIHTYLDGIMTTSPYFSRYGFIRIGFDDAEALTPSLQKALNFLIRVDENRKLRWTVAYTTGRYDSMTTVNNLPLRRVEIETLQLDKGDRDFSDLCEKVVIRRLWDNGILVKEGFLQEFLGKFQYNDLISFVLSKSGTSLAREFKSIQGDFTETYVNRVLKPKDPYRLDDKDRTRAAALRKKRAAVLIHICSRLGVPVPYSGWDTICELADGCIRDFLEVMGRFPIEYYQVFANQDKSQPLDIQVQTVACHQNAEDRLLSFPFRTDQHKSDIPILIQYCGYFIQYLQHESGGQFALKNPDISILQIDLKTQKEELSKKRLDLIELFKAAEEYGLMRNLSETKKTGREWPEPSYYFALSNRLVPFFDISHRQKSSSFVTISFFENSIMDCIKKNLSRTRVKERAVIDAKKVIKDRKKSDGQNSQARLGI